MGAGNRPARAVPVDRRERHRFPDWIPAREAGIAAEAQSVDSAVGRLGGPAPTRSAACRRRALVAQSRRAWQDSRGTRAAAAAGEPQLPATLPGRRPVAARSNPHHRNGDDLGTRQLLRRRLHLRVVPLSAERRTPLPGRTDRGVLPEAASPSRPGQHPLASGSVAAGAGGRPEAVLEGDGAATKPCGGR